MSSPLEQYLAELGDLSKPVITSRLTELSALSAEELAILKREWPQIDVARRRLIMERLIELTEDNFDLDFDDFCRICLPDSDSEVRVRAIEGLYACEERSLIEPLINLLIEDEEHTVRATAATALGRFAMLAELGRLSADDADRVEQALLTAFDEQNEQPSVLCRVLEAISPLDKPHVQEMIRQMYHSNDLEFRASALYSMGLNCNPIWLPILLKELRSLHPQLRFEAVGACGELEAEDAVPHIAELIEDSDAEVQIAAIEALGRIGGGEANECLKQCLNNPDEAVREAAEEALDEIGFWEDPFDL
ncbi:MAG: HEAT repeat domain-containing protein [Chloroflexota bacterium]|nr:HEAT repeat domain-containing protein [Chloroflexota bacterium]